VFWLSMNGYSLRSHANNCCRLPGRDYGPDDAETTAKHHRRCGIDGIVFQARQSSVHNVLGLQSHSRTRDERGEGRDVEDTAILGLSQGTVEVRSVDTGRVQVFSEILDKAPDNNMSTDTGLLGDQTNDCCPFGI